MTWLMVWMGCSALSPTPEPAETPEVVGTSVTGPAVPAVPEAAIIDVVISGALQAALRAGSVECRGSMAGILDAAWTGRIDGQQSVLVLQTPYQLTLKTGEQVAREARAQLFVGDEVWTWHPSREPDGVVLDASGALFNQWNPISDLGRSVQVNGSLRCPPLMADPPVPQALVDLLHGETGAEVIRYGHFDFGRARDGRMISARMDRHRADQTVRRIRGHLPPGWVAFRGTSRFDPDLGLEGVDVVIGPGTDNRHILRLAHTAPGPWSTEQVVAKIDEWDSRYGVDVFFAMDDSIGFLVHNPPADLLPFAQELTAFCPDIVRDSLGSPEALAEAIHASGGVLLWWN